jgi:hypothetical protein
MSSKDELRVKNGVFGAGAIGGQSVGGGFGQQQRRQHQRLDVD